ncbi:isochorismatase domain-containing protein 1-like [Branchiostoma floridae x Branchiostoma japonicum]
MAATRVLGNLSAETAAFFLCDMQERFRPAIKFFPEILQIGQRLVEASKILDIPLIVTEQYPNGLGSTVAELDVSSAKVVVPKTKFSMVVPEVEEVLKSMAGLRSVVLFGIEAHVCVQQTALDLLARGLEVHVIADATSSRSQMDRVYAFDRLRQAGAVLTTSESTLLQLVGDKNHPKFKEIQGLIKVSAPDSGLVPKM